MGNGVNEGNQEASYSIEARKWGKTKLTPVHVAVVAASWPSFSLAWALAYSATRLWPFIGDDLGVLGVFEGLCGITPTKGLSGSFDCEVVVRLGCKLQKTD